MDLDDDYQNGTYIAGAGDYPPRWAAQAKAFRAGLGTRARLNLPYGDSTRQVYDLFEPDGHALGTVVFIHGGYWRAFDKSSWSHLAAGPLARGWRVAMPSYDLCPSVTVSGITQQMRAFCNALAVSVEGAMRITGHSAGGHLTMRMAAPGMLGEDVISRVEKWVPISGLGDLAPLIRTSINEDLRLTPQEAKAESPIHQPAPGAPVTAWVGAQERPAFIEQTRAIARAWHSELIVEDGKHHFDVIDSLADPDGALTNSVLA